MEFDLWCVYDSLIKLTESRSWKSLERVLSQDEFNNMIRNMNYIKIVGTDRDGMPTTIVLTKPDSNIPNQSKMFVSLVNSLDTKIILISGRILSDKIMAKAIEMKVDVESHTYDKFVTDMRKCPYVPKHEIATPEEVENLLSFNYKKITDLPSIMSDDTQVIWIGAKVGDVVKITRFSEVTGYSVYYRLVKAGTIQVKK